jgi:hypothetical protein
MARRASLLPVHLQPCLPAADRRPEIHRRLVFEIGAGLRAARTLRLLLPAEDAREDVLEARPASALLLLSPAALEPRKVEPAEINRNAARAAVVQG